jgi:L-amino acid N-acyltransferase YncA
MVIRDAGAADWPGIWAVMRPIVVAGETFPYDTTIDEDEARRWLAGPPGRAAVAVTPDGMVAGTASMGPNRGGPGAHVATASFMVGDEHRGRGVGRSLVEDALAWARRRGFRGMQFNAVAASNTPAVRLYESLGFEILGTVPEGFLHPTEGYVGLHVMYRRL